MEQESYKKTYTFHEFYTALYKGLRTKKYMVKAKKNKELSHEFVERIMLAVTEVNGCEICSYAHTKWALEAGLSSDEIRQLLSGISESIPEEEMHAILFAQHYSDTKGHPSKGSWDRIVEAYGSSKAYGILGAVCEIMIGNIMGAPASAFLSRLKGKPYKNSNPFKELGLILSVLIYFPAALIAGAIANLAKKPVISY
jgi:AhpD family alkylhydroperoxidase